MDDTIQSPSTPNLFLTTFSVRTLFHNMSTNNPVNDQKPTEDTDDSVHLCVDTEVVHPVVPTTPTTTSGDTSSESGDPSSEPLSPIRSEDYKPGGKYESLFWCSSCSSSSSMESTPSSTSTESTPLCEPYYGDQFGRYSVSLLDRHYDCRETPFHTPSYKFILPLVEESPPRKRVRRRLFPHDNSTPPTPKYFRNINYID